MESKTVTNFRLRVTRYSINLINISYTGDHIFGRAKKSLLGKD